jgi:hypothetical protein
MIIFIIIFFNFIYKVREAYKLWSSSLLGEHATIEPFKFVTKID